MNNAPIFNFIDTDVYLEKTFYENKQVAITIKEVEPDIEGDDMFAVLTSATDTPLEEGEVAVKLYSENAPFKPLLDTPYFVDTGKRIPAGFTEIHIWKIVDYSVFNEAKKTN